MANAPEKSPYIVTFRFEDGRTECFAAIETIFEYLVEEALCDWFYVPQKDGAAVVRTAGLQWVSVRPWTDYD